MTKLNCVCGHAERDHLRGKGLCRRFECPCEAFRPRSAEARFRVDFFIRETGQWAEYTAKKRLLEIGMARAYAAHLDRSGQRWRIIEVVGKEERIFEFGNTCFEKETG